MATNEAIVKFKAETTQFNSAMKKLNDETKKLRQEFKLQSEQMKHSSSDTEKYQASLDNLNQQYEVSKKRTQETNDQLQKAKAVYGENSVEVAKLETQLKRNEITEQQLANRIHETTDRLNDAKQAEAERNSEAAKSAQKLEELKGKEEKLTSTTEKLNAEYELQKAQLSENASESDKLKLKMDHLTKSHDVAADKVKNYEEQLEHAKKQYGENSVEVDQYETQLLEARTAEQQLANEIFATNKELIEQSDQLKKATDAANQMADKMMGLGKDLSMKVTAPIVGIGLASLKVGMDFEASMSNVQAISGATGKDIEKLEKTAREWGSKTSKSASEAADALGYMALAGWDTTQMMDGLEPVLRLSEAGNLDLARASDLVTDSMAAMGLEVKDLPGYLNQVAQASRKSNTDIDALMEAFLVTGGTLSSFNVPIEESTALLGVLANRGYKGAEAGTAMNAIFTNLTSGLGGAGKAMKKLDINAFNLDGTFKGLEEVLLEVKDKVSGMTEEQQAQYISMIAGKEHMKTFQALMAGLGDEYGELKTDIQNSDGALEDMAKTMQDNAKGKITELKSALEEVGIAFSQHVIPFVTKGTEKITEIVQKFGELDEGTQKAIITVLGLAAAAGPLLIVGSKLIKGVTATITIGKTLATVVGGLSTVTAGAGASAGIMAKGVALLSNPVGWAILGVGALTLGTIELVRHLKKDAIEVDRFGDSIDGLSEETRTAAESFYNLSDDVGTAVLDMKIRGTTVTSEMAEDMTSKMNTMHETIVSGLEKSHEARLASMKTFFENSSVLSDAEEEKILQKEQQQHENKMLGMQAQNEQINAIMQKASEEKRALTEAEASEIERIRQAMNDSAVVALTESEVEQKIIMQRIKDTAGEMTALQAAEVAKNSAEQRDKAVSAAQEQYESTLAEIIRMRDETGVITEEQANQMIAEATRQKDVSVKMAEDMHKEVIDQAKQQADEHVNQVNWETGEVLTKWQSFKASASQKWTEIKEDAGKKWEEKRKLVVSTSTKLVTSAFSSISDLKDKASAKWTEMRNDASQKWDEMRNNGRQKFEELKESMYKPIEVARDKISDAVDKVKSFFSNLKLKFPKIDMPKLPRFKMTGNFSLNPPSVPKIGIDWFAKGGIMKAPTIFGVNGNRMLGGGEAGPEAILPLNEKNLGKIGEMIAMTMQPQTPIVISSTPVILDGRVLGEIIFEYTDQLGGSKQSLTAYMKGV